MPFLVAKVAAVFLYRLHNMRGIDGDIKLSFFVGKFA